MSTEARAPGEDVEGLATIAAGLDVVPFLASVIKSGEDWTPEVEAAVEKARAARITLSTLRDLSRKLEVRAETLAETQKKLAHMIVYAQQKEAALEEAKGRGQMYLDALRHAEQRAEAAEAALEEARRERDEARVVLWCGGYKGERHQWEMDAEEEHVWCAKCGVDGRIVAHLTVEQTLRALSPQPQEPATEGEEGT